MGVSQAFGPRLVTFQSETAPTMAATVPDGTVNVTVIVPEPEVGVSRSHCSTRRRCVVLSSPWTRLKACVVLPTTHVTLKTEYPL